MEELEGAICLFVSVMIINQVISFKVYLVDFIYILFLHILLVRNNFSAKEKKGVGGSHVPSVPPLNHLWWWLFFWESTLASLRLL